jgi:hypothetical protein
MEEEIARKEMKASELTLEMVNNTLSDWGTTIRESSRKFTLLIMVCVGIYISIYRSEIYHTSILNHLKMFYLCVN